MHQTVQIPPLFFYQHVFHLNRQKKTFFFLMPDFTSYLTAAGACQSRDLVLKLTHKSV